MHAAWSRRIQLAVVMAGGYGKVIEDTVVVHTQTVGIASAYWKWWHAVGVNTDKAFESACA